MSRSVLVGALVVWAIAVVAGFGLLGRYKATAATQADEPPLAWPAASALERTPGRPTLVLFVHPHCGCTQATVTELARLLARVQGPLDVRVAVARPDGVEAGWDDTALVGRAEAIPGVAVFRDAGGTEAERFAARASGFTVVYGADGRRLFAGGLTSARGHEGESFGGRRIVSLLETGAADRGDAPTFGCALASTAAVREEGTE
ncbi:MAG: RedB protein [Vicinamibacteria bacterium]